MFRRRAIVGTPVVASGYQNIGYPSSIGYGSSNGYVTPSRFGLRKFGLTRGKPTIYIYGNAFADPLTGVHGRHHFLHRWRNVSPVTGGTVKHSNLFYGTGYGVGRVGIFQRLKMKLGFGKVHYGGGSTITNNGWNSAPVQTIL
jgi:hypothetical protein